MSPNNKCVWFQLLVFPCLQTDHPIISNSHLPKCAADSDHRPIPAQYDIRGRGASPKPTPSLPRHRGRQNAVILVNF